MTKHEKICYELLLIWKIYYTTLTWPDLTLQTWRSNFFPFSVDDFDNVALDVDVAIRFLADLQSLDQRSGDGILQNLNVRMIEFGESHPAFRRHGDHLLDDHNDLQNWVQHGIALIVGTDFKLQTKFLKLRIFTKSTHSILTCFTAQERFDLKMRILFLL